MTTRNLDALFSPRAIALIGANAEPGSVGAIVARNLLSGGFTGRIMFVNPRATDVLGQPCYPSAAALPAAPDLTVIATPPRAVPGLIAELGAAGCRAAVVITAGFTTDQKQAMLSPARLHLMRIIGPNCLGFLSPVRGINGSFSHMAPLKGRLALLSQSGAIATSIIDWANGNGIGFSHLVSMGDMAMWTLETCWTSSPWMPTRAPSFYTRSQSPQRGSSCPQDGLRRAPNPSSFSRLAAARRAPRLLLRTQARLQVRMQCMTPPSDAPACCGWTRCGTFSMQQKPSIAAFAFTEIGSSY